MSIELFHLAVVIASQVGGRGIAQYRRHSPEVQSLEREYINSKSCCILRAIDEICLLTSGFMCRIGVLLIRI